jgi:NAD(P)-dependent dehydrogenase (short-subunit alcohol dehydrogenase family)
MSTPDPSAWSPRKGGNKRNAALAIRALCTRHFWRRDPYHDQGWICGSRTKLGSLRAEAAALGGADLLVANVGGSSGKGLLESTPEDWVRTFDLNLRMSSRPCGFESIR